jgi:hypothetical protein
MSAPPEARREFCSKIAILAFFLVTAVSIACEFWFISPMLYPSATLGRFVVGVAALVSPVAYLCACGLAFFRPHFAYGLGLVAGLMGLPWFVLAEHSSQISSWIIFNVALEQGSWPRVFIILSVAFIVVSSSCATLRLLPVRWTLRKRPFGQRSWPAIATGVLALGIWLYHAGTPYQTPLVADVVEPTFSILRVEKRGLRFEETAITAYRDGQFFISRTKRSLLQYKFATHVSHGVIPYKEVEAFRRSAEVWKLRMVSVPSLHSWNAAGWYVVGQSKILAYSTENKMEPPQLIVDMFNEIENQPMVATPTVIGRDVCFGFCYGPLAALGFKYSNSFVSHPYLTP